MKITNLRDVQDGDIVAVEFEGGLYTGPAQLSEDERSLEFLGLTLRASDGTTSTFMKFIEAERAVPSEPGTIFVDVVLKGGNKYKAAYIDDHGDLLVVRDNGILWAYKVSDIESYGGTL